MAFSADSHLTTTARTHARTETEIDFPVGSPAPQPPILIDNNLLCPGTAGVPLVDESKPIIPLKASSQ